MIHAQPILPGSRIGVLGSGQLGRMFALAARRMGYRVHVLSPDTDTPTGQIADVEIAAPYEDLDRVRAFARDVDVVTFEFENVPYATAEAAAEHAPVRPGGSVLHTTQERGREKRFLVAHGFPVPAHALVQSSDEALRALDHTGLPAVLKSVEFGYDGKGQRILRRRGDVGPAWRSIGAGSCVIEAFVDFELECSVVAARGVDGVQADSGSSRIATWMACWTSRSCRRASTRAWRGAPDRSRGTCSRRSMSSGSCVSSSS